MSESLANQISIPFLNKVNYVSLRKLQKLKTKIRVYALVFCLLQIGYVILDILMYNTLKDDDKNTLLILNNQKKHEFTTEKISKYQNFKNTDLASRSPFTTLDKNAVKETTD